MDELDWLLLQALAHSPREPNRSLARVLDVSEQTIGRRYRRLVARGLRVCGVTHTSLLGLEPWTLRLHAAPSAVADLAAALAKRRDTAWIHLASGGTEIIFNALLPATDTADSLLGKLPRTSQVRRFTAHLLLDSPLQPGASTLIKVAPYHLGDRQTKALGHLPVATQDPPAPSATDNRILNALAADGRLPTAELANRINEPESTTRARLQKLQTNGSLRFAIDIPDALLGRQVAARLWLSVTPASVLDAARELAEDPATTFVALTTGPTNLVATVTCATVAELARFTTYNLGQLPGVQTVETAPIQRTIKRFTT